MSKKDLEKVITEELYDRETRRMTQEMYLEFRKSNFPNPKQPINYPDAKKHQTVSFFKSAVRLIGYSFIPFSLVTSTILLILSEIIGIIEELV